MGSEISPGDLGRESLSSDEQTVTNAFEEGIAAARLYLFHLAQQVVDGYREHKWDILIGDDTQAAQVFLKRLKIGMVLGSDVTAFYGAIKDGVPPSVTYDSPYNTRIHKGLPPGPISNVTDSSLYAVAHPANTDWLYFVAGDDGKTYFAKTEAEHEANVSKYCHKLCSATQ